MYAAVEQYGKILCPTVCHCYSVCNLDQWTDLRFMCLSPCYPLSCISSKKKTKKKQLFECLNGLSELKKFSIFCRMHITGLCTFCERIGRRRTLHLLQISLLVLCTLAVDRKENVPHSRQKRILWVTSDGRLALPPGTTLVITPSLSLPFVRYPPDGFFSNITVSLPFTSKYTLYKLVLWFARSTVFPLVAC